MARIITLVAIAVYFYLSAQMLTNKGGGADIVFAITFVFLLLVHFLIMGVVVLVKRHDKTGNEKPYLDSLWMVVACFLLFAVFMIIGGDQLVRSINPSP